MKKTKAKKIIAITLLSVLLFVGVLFFVASLCGGLVFVYPPVNPKDGQIRVACVGDSITYGAMAVDWYTKTYPYRLEKLLGSGYDVANFGVCCTTAMSSGNRPFEDETQFSKSLEYAPDVVVIMFGTNDSKNKNWRGKEEFIAQYSALIAKYTALESVERVIICTPPDIYKEKWDMQPDVISGDVCEAVFEIAADLEITVADVNKVTEGHGEYFADYVHPNAKGTKVLASCVYDAIMAA